MENGKFCRMVDSTDYYPVPPPHYNISTSKTSVFLKPGQSEKFNLISLQIISEFDLKVILIRIFTGSFCFK